MSNGGGESGSQQREVNGKRKFYGNNFAYAVARMAVAQTCESVEASTLQESQAREGVRFNSFQMSALETLTDVMVQYIQNIGKAANLYANTANRAEGNAFDIVQALEDLGSGLGFTGASDMGHCLADSGVVKDIARYIGEAEEIPFAYSLPQFPFNKGKRPTRSFAEVGTKPPNEHIPDWLPAFPDTQMHIQSEAGEGRAVDGDSGRAELNVESKENGSGRSHVDRLGFHKSVDQKDVEKATEEAEGNPFLAAPLRSGEKEVSLVVRPAELSNKTSSISHVLEERTDNDPPPVLEAFGHEIPKNTSESEDGKEKEPAKKRSLVQFKIDTRKTLARNRVLEEKGNENMAAWFQEDEEKSEKAGKEGNCKRLTQELTQM